MEDTSWLQGQLELSEVLNANSEACKAANLTLKCSFCMNRLFTQATHFLGFCRSFAVNQLLSSAAS